MIKPIYAYYKLSAHVENYLFQSTMVFAIQALILILVIRGAMEGEDGLDY